MLLAQLQVEKSIYPREKESLLETMNLHQDTSLGGADSTSAERQGAGICVSTAPGGPRHPRLPAALLFKEALLRTQGIPQGSPTSLHNRAVNDTVLGIRHIGEAAFSIVIISLK